MSLKICNYLFTGPFPVEKTNRRANQAETVFAIVIKAGSAWDPSFSLLDLGRTGAAGTVFAQHPRAADWVDSAGAAANVYLLDVATKSQMASDLDNVIGEISAAYPTFPAPLK
jgi:hypothetical protein